MSATQLSELDNVLKQSQQAFDIYKKISPVQRALFLESIADEIEKLRAELVEAAHAETHLPLPRLNGEIGRTTAQLKLFARLIKEGSWVEAAIDTADNNRVPAKPDTRKLLVPVGPVVVFGASNFPFAFSTAGGDTASVLASGSTVIIKGHPAHPNTSLLAFAAIQKAIQLAGLPLHTVQHIASADNSMGEALVKHPLTTGVAFTGSFKGGTALLDYARQRPNPIPVFAEMGSVNPVVFLPDTLRNNAATLAQTYAASITLGMGQFCTNPGLLLAIESEDTDTFLQLLGEEISKIVPQKMLHTGIQQAYNKGLSGALAYNGVELLGKSFQALNELDAAPTVAKVNGANFLANPHLQEEVFGPYSLAVVCADKEELLLALQQLNGQLTSTLMATDADLAEHADILELQASIAGRVILNTVPTGVEVCASMVHGGPYPATTDARFTSVGTTAIKRWVRPVCLQGFTDALLPEALQNSNPLHIWRIVNNVWTKDAVEG